MGGSVNSSAAEELQDLLLQSADFISFLLKLSVFSAARFSGPGTAVLCSLSVEGAEGPVTVASSDERAARMDEIQYGFNEGPCLLALRSGVTVVSADLAADERWVRYGQAVAHFGIRSALCVAVTTDPGSLAALNCYAPEPDFFGPGQRADLESFAATLSRTLRLALRAPAAAPYAGLPALRSRAMIDAAISLVMLHTRTGREAALALIVAAARARDETMRDTARAILAGRYLPHEPG